MVRKGEDPKVDRIGRMCHKLDTNWAQTLLNIYFLALGQTVNNCLFVP